MDTPQTNKERNGPRRQTCENLSTKRDKMSENLSLVAKMRMWNSNRVHCVSEKIIITKKVQGKPQMMGKRQNLSSGHILTVAYKYLPSRLTPSDGGCENKSRIPWDKGVVSNQLSK